MLPAAGQASFSYYVPTSWNKLPKVLLPLTQHLFLSVIFVSELPLYLHTLSCQTIIYTLPKPLPLLIQLNDHFLKVVAHFTVEL